MGGAHKVNPHRIRLISPGAQLPKPGKGDAGGGGIVYWINRDKRAQDNWALLHAAELSEAHAVPLSVVYCLEPPGPHATPREYSFRLKGLAEVQSDLDKLQVPFRLLKGEAASELASFCKRHEVAAVVCDFSPIRESRACKDGLVEQAPDLPVYEVDAHNIVPVWVASDKQEVGARTIRKKITDKLSTWLVDIPALPKRSGSDPSLPSGMRDEFTKDKVKDWEALLREVLADDRVDSTVEEVKDFPPGPAAGLQAVDRFCADRLKIFADKRNDPTIEACSELSPYVNFGFLSAQRMALEVKEHSKNRHEGVSAFLEESIVRRELSDNFCHYQPNYDSLEGAAGWARESLQLHAKDKREHLYSLDDLTHSRTHDDLWNAAQTQMVQRGKMHGFLRMYWAKKILEWSPTPEEALRHSIWLNDHFELDGRDPNGYVGCAWSVMGTHDMGWAERAVFGKIRYMNYNGCKRKFNVAAFVDKWARAETHKAGAPKAGGSKATSKAGAKGKKSAAASPAGKSGAAASPNKKTKTAGDSAASGAAASNEAEESKPKPPAKKAKLGIPLP